MSTGYGTASSTKSRTFFKGIKNKVRSFIKSTKTLEQSVNDLIKQHDTEHSPISYEEKQLIQKVIKYRNLIANDIMIPRADIDALPENATLNDIKKKVMQNNYTRIPIYHDTLDNVVGFVNLKDLLPLLLENKKITLKAIMREILVVSPTMKLIDLLVKMKETRVHIAVVVDDYGGTDGLITFEDLVEEIVGDIEDEFDEKQSTQIMKIKPNVYIADGRAKLLDVAEKTGLSFDEKEIDLYSTIGGYILHQAGHVPKKGETIHNNHAVEFQIIDSNLRSVRKLLIKMKPDHDV
jgi:magnesium and cobalt transporter